MADESISHRACRPARTQSGWACGRWRSAEGEWYCGQCGLALPPVAIGLEPLVGTSAPAAGKTERQIEVVLARTPALRDQDIKDFELAITTTDPDESDDVALIRLEPGQKTSRFQVGLDCPAGRNPFDVTLALRHKKNRAAPSPLTTGCYDYPTPTVQLDPPGPVALPRTPAQFTARLQFQPQAARAVGVRLAVPSLNLHLPGVITHREPGRLDVRFDLPAGGWAVVEKSLHGLQPAKLAVEFHGVLSAVTVAGAQVIRVTPPNLNLALADKVRALSGRRARIAMLLANAGGAPATITAVDWVLRSAAGKVASGSNAEFADRLLPAQDDIHEELRPLLLSQQGQPLPPGLYNLDVTVSFRGEGLDAPDTRSRTIELEIRPLQNFAGRVCIDFGTTDTAAAIMLKGENYFVDKARGQPPMPIELGRIGIAGKRPQYFMPTRAAVGMDDNGNIAVRYGAAAIREVNGLHHGRLIDRLKWRLGEAAELDGFAGHITIEDLAVGYLKEICALIEEHPAVAAQLGEVVATRPANFGPKARVLVQAFGRAGMSVDLTTLGENVAPLVSESWPPVLFTVPIPEGGGSAPSARLLRSLFDRFPGETPPQLAGIDALRQSPHFLCTFDIGGGSLDTSLLRMQVDGDQVCIIDLAAFTNERFAGEWFRDLILEEVACFAPGIVYGEVEGLAQQNLDALRRFASQVQNNNGPFSAAYSLWEVFFAKLLDLDTQGISRLWRYRKDPVDAPLPADMPDLLKTLYTELQPVIARSERVEYPLRLQGQSGPLDLLFSLGGESHWLEKLMVRIILRFFETYGIVILELCLQLQLRLSQETSDRPVRILLTGRGSLFPLVEPLVAACAMKVLTVARSDIYRSAGESAKAVTSWGGLALRVSRDATDMLEFQGLGSGGCALYGPSGMSGTPYAALRPVGGAVWGLPLAELQARFSRSRLVMAGEDQGETESPECVARMEKFNLKGLLSAQPNAWLLFDRDEGVLEVGMPRMGKA